MWKIGNYTTIHVWTMERTKENAQTHRFQSSMARAKAVHQNVAMRIGGRNHGAIW